MSKVETLEEFLARGGTIQKLAPIAEEVPHMVRSTAQSAPAIHSLAEAEYLFGQKRQQKEKIIKRYTNEELITLLDRIRDDNK